MSRAWFPVGRLDVESDEATREESYRFRYTGGAMTAKEAVGFDPQSVLIDYEGRAPEGGELMASPDFRPLID